jgi:hypothetical protein
MAARRTALVIVLALLAGATVVSGPQASRLVEQHEALDTVGALAQLGRCGKKLERPKRAHRNASHERSLAPQPAFVLRRADVVVVAEPIPVPASHAHRSEPIALARAPPSA